MSYYSTLKEAIKNGNVEEVAKCMKDPSFEVDNHHKYVSHVRKLLIIVTILSVRGMPFLRLNVSLNFSSTSFFFFFFFEEFRSFFLSTNLFVNFRSDYYKSTPFMSSIAWTKKGQPDYPQRISIIKMLLEVCFLLLKKIVFTFESYLTLLSRYFTLEICLLLK